jgi:hydrogenase-4 component E
MPMLFWQDPQFGAKMITLMAALVLVLQILMVAQRWLVTNIRAFGVQSFLLAAIATTIAYFNHAPHMYAVAALTLVVKAILVPVVLERLVTKIGIRQEIEPLVNVPISVIVSGLLTLLAYIVAESLHRPEEATGPATLGHNTLAVAIALFLIGFFMMVNRRKALTQVLGLLCLENGLLLAAISLTYGMPLIVEIGIFFDVLVAALVLAILIDRIRETFDSMDVSRLSRLRG